MKAVEKLLHGKWQQPYDLTIWHEQIDGYSIDGCCVLSESNFVIIFRRENGSVNKTRPEIKLLRFFRERSPQISGATLSNIEIIGYVEALNEEEAIWSSNIGDIYYLRKDNATSGFEALSIDRKNNFGYKTIKDLVKIDSTVYAAAGWRHVFKRLEKDHWVDLSNNIDRTDIINKKGTAWDTNKSGRVGFSTVGGVSDRELYAAGDGGDCWYFNGETWSQLDIPTNERVYKIVAIDSKKVYMACGGGVLLEGSMNQWKIIKYPDNAENFTQMVLFKNTIFVSTQYNMYKLVDDKLEECMPAKQNSEIEMFCHHYLSANEDIMLMCGQQSVAIFDGEFWLPLAPNEPINASIS